jgi:hypothetical protein
MCYEERLFRSWFTKLARKRERQIDGPEQNPPFVSSPRCAPMTKSPHQGEPWSEQKRPKRHEPEEVI